jgi:hypothetical protein
MVYTLAMSKRKTGNGVKGLNPLRVGESIPEPKLKTTDVLVWLYRNRADRFTVRDVASHFKLAHGEAQRRVQYIVVSWNAARSIGRVPAHRRGRREVEYALTAWGRKYAAKRVKNG